MDKDRKPKSPIGVKNLVLIPLLTDTEENLEYGEAESFKRRLMAVRVTPDAQRFENEADNQVVESNIINYGGEIEVTITDVNDDDRAFIYGNTQDGGITYESQEDIPGEFAVAWESTKSDYTPILKKVFKAQFIPSEETNTTVRRAGIEYQATVLRGRYYPLAHNGRIRAFLDSASDMYSEENHESWFTEGTFDPVDPTG